MKVSAVQKGGLDERLILKKELAGVIPCEKCYVNGSGQYWYDITGKQALDNFCKINVVEGSFLEQLLLSICNVLEQMEWNLIDEKCLQLAPEMIFVNYSGEEIGFVLYPETESENIYIELRLLMEYLLTKIDHTEKTVVAWVYELYEYIVSEEYGITDLKNKILKRRIQELDVKEIENGGTMYVEEFREPEESLIETAIAREKPMDMELKDLWNKSFQKLKELLEKKDKREKEDYPIVIYPEDEESTEQIKIHPTVCMVSRREEAKGLLVYEGIGEYPDFEIGTLMCVVGKSHRVKLQIEKDTISQFHAKIDYQEGGYYIEDMNSTNGTFVNDEMLNYKEKRKLQPGDIVQFADVKYRFW